MRNGCYRRGDSTFLHVVIAWRGSIAAAGCLWLGALIEFAALYEHARTVANSGRFQDFQELVRLQTRTISNKP